MAVQISVKVSLRGTYEACVDNYKSLTRVLGSIREMGHDVANLETRVHEADARLFVFGRIHNLVVLSSTGEGAGVGEMPPYWVNAVMTHMFKIKDLQEDGEKILSRYAPTSPSHLSGGAGGSGSGVVANADAARVQSDTSIMLFDLTSRPTNSTVVSHAKTEYEERSATVQSVSLAKKAAWSFKDRQKLALAVDEIERQNDALFNLTVPQLGTLLYDAVASRLSTDEFRHKYQRTPGSTGEEADGAFRQEQLKLRMSETAAAREFVGGLARETKAQKMKRMLPITDFSDLSGAEMTEQQPARHTTTFGAGEEAETVLVEWKEYNPNRITRGEVILRISDITAILNAPPSFMDNVLSSPGFFEDNSLNDSGMGRVGIVYRLSGISQPDKMRTLRSLLVRNPPPPCPSSSTSSTSTPPQPTVGKPVLGDRFKLALGLAHALLSIHNCRWFHKGLRPENVVFFQANARAVGEPFLLGWDYARAAAKGQMTETVFSQESDSELYLHPGWFAPTDDQGDDDARVEGHRARPRERFKQEYDHYQLGCLLLEIGYWRLLSDIKKYSNRKFVGEGWREAWREYMVSKARKLDAEMGKIYTDVVVSLLRGLDADGQDLEFWDAVVLQLSRCRV